MRGSKYRAAKIKRLQKRDIPIEKVFLHGKNVFIIFWMLRKFAKEDSLHGGTILGK